MEHVKGKYEAQFQDQFEILISPNKFLNPRRFMDCFTRVHVLSLPRAAAAAQELPTLCQSWWLSNPEVILPRNGNDYDPPVGGSLFMNLIEQLEQFAEPNLGIRIILSYRRESSEIVLRLCCQGRPTQ